MVKVLNAADSQLTGRLGCAGVMTESPVAWRVWLTPCKNSEKRMPIVRIPSPDCGMMVPSRSASVVVSRARNKLMEWTGPTSLPMNEVMKFAVPSSMPRVAGLGMSALVLMLMPAPFGASPGRSKLTSTVPGTAEGVVSKTLSQPSDGLRTIVEGLERDGLRQYHPVELRSQRLDPE